VGLAGVDEELVDLDERLDEVDEKLNESVRGPMRSMRDSRRRGEAR